MPGAEAVRYLLTIPPHPSGVWETFKQNVKQRPIRLQFEAPVLDLVQDPDTLEVFGVIAQIGEERAAIRARRGVVLCCGGYENDLGMLRNYWGVDRVYSYGTPGNTGDGVRSCELSRCPANASGDAECVCDAGWQGAACAQPLCTGALGGCTGRGVCKCLSGGALLSECAR